MSVLEQLKKTREILATRGRTTGELIDRETCKVCLLGAIGLAVLGDEFEEDPDYRYFAHPDRDWDGEPDRTGAAIEVVDALLKERPRGGWDDSYTDLYLFNDTEAQNDEEVFALIDRAIQRAGDSK